VRLGRIRLYVIEELAEFLRERQERPIEGAES